MSIGTTLRNRVMMLDDFTCVYCAYRGADVVIDHFIPAAKGGPDIEENLVAACVRCNSLKGNRAPYQARLIAKHGRFAAVTRNPWEDAPAPPARPQRIFIHARNEGDLPVAPDVVPADEQRRILAAARSAPSRRAVCKELYGTVGGQKYQWVQTVADAAGLLGR